MDSPEYIDDLTARFLSGALTFSDTNAERVVADELRRRLEARATLDEALQRFPDSAAAVALVAAVLKVSIEAVPEFEEDTRHERIRAAIAEASSEARTRAMVVCTALMRVASECRQMVLMMKDEAGDPDVTSGKATVLPDGWLVIEMQGKEIARMPFNPQRPAEEAEQIAADTLAEFVVIHPQGEGEVHAVLGGVFDDPDGSRPPAMRVAVPRASENR